MLLEQLQHLLAKTEIMLSLEQQQQLIDYVLLLNKWNKAYNLTSVREPKQMLVRHIVDSLVVSPHLRGKCFIDVGTGPGLPGVPLAIANPDTHFILLDSLGKRIRFLTEVKSALGLNNISLVQSRVEQYQPEPQKPIDGVISRAFASLNDMVNWCLHLIEPGHHFYALKGQYPEEEIAALNNSVTVSAVEKLEVPQLEAERHLVILLKSETKSAT